MGNGQQEEPFKLVISKVRAIFVDVCTTAQENALICPEVYLSYIILRNSILLIGLFFFALTLLKTCEQQQQTF